MLDDKKAVIFDLDGTITDSMWVWTDIDREFFEKKKIEMPADFQSEIEGMSFTETAEYFIDKFSLSVTADTLKEEWTKMAVRKYEYEITIKPGFMPFINHLKNNGIKAGIATSNSPMLLDIFLRKRKLDSFFQAVTTSCDVQKGKPAPDVYLKTAEKLNATPKECLVFEDIPMGILSAKNAGMQVCAIEDDYSVRMRDKKRELADYYITDYRQVLTRTYEVLI